MHAAANAPDDLAAHVIRESVKRAPAPDPERIDEVVFGNANGAGEEYRNVARMVTLLAGLPVSNSRHHGQPVVRVLIGRGDHRLPAVNAGNADLVLVGGAESMSPAPWVLPRTEKAVPGRGPDLGFHHAGLAAGEQSDAEGVLKDFERQQKLGLDPVFDPRPLGITGATFWESYKTADQKPESARL